MKITTLIHQIKASISLSPVSHWTSGSASLSWANDASQNWVAWACTVVRNPSHRHCYHAELYPDRSSLLLNREFLRSWVHSYDEIFSIKIISFAKERKKGLRSTHRYSNGFQDFDSKAQRFPYLAQLDRFLLVLSWGSTGYCKRVRGGRVLKEEWEWEDINLSGSRRGRASWTHLAAYANAALRT